MNRSSSYEAVLIMSLILALLRERSMSTTKQYGKETNKSLIRLTERRETPTVHAACYSLSKKKKKKKKKNRNGLFYYYRF